MSGGGFMVTKTVDITQMQAVKEYLLSLLEKDTEIILTEGDIPLAKLTQVEQKKSKRVAGLHPGAMTMHDDFDEPLPDSFWLGDE
jgi:antitoxin (DNA-binding transcriptional repressor) of toxin-antitoxin stability system